MFLPETKHSAAAAAFGYFAKECISYIQSRPRHIQRTQPSLQLLHKPYSWNILVASAFWEAEHVLEVSSEDFQCPEDPR